MFGAEVKDAAFTTLLQRTVTETSDDKCSRSGDWIDYTKKQVEFYDNLVKIPAFVAALALAVAIVLVVLDTTATRGAAIATGVVGLLGAGSLFAILKDLAKSAQERYDKAVAARPADCP